MDDKFLSGLKIIAHIYQEVDVMKGHVLECFKSNEKYYWKEIAAHILQQLICMNVVRMLDFFVKTPSIIILQALYLMKFPF